jgi:hypothetical protein
VPDAALFLLMYVVFPVWVLAGLADWACHVRTRIAETSGLAENVLHWVMFAEIGAGLLAVALLELDAAVLAIVLAVFVLHEATVYWDLAYSTMRRDVGPFEQMVHSFLELLPLASLALLAVIAWPQALALVGAGSELADWSLRPKAEPWPLLYLAGAAGATVLFNALPLAQETAACLRARSRPRQQQRRMEPSLHA